MDRKSYQKTPKTLCPPYNIMIQVSAASRVSASCAQTLCTLSQHLQTCHSLSCLSSRKTIRISTNLFIKTSKIWSQLPKNKIISFIYSLRKFNLSSEISKPIKRKAPLQNKLSISQIQALINSTLAETQHICTSSMWTSYSILRPKVTCRNLWR